MSFHIEIESRAEAEAVLEVLRRADGRDDNGALSVVSLDVERFAKRLERALRHPRLEDVPA